MKKILNSDRVVRQCFGVFFFALWSNLSGYSFVFVSLPVEQSYPPKFCAAAVFAAEQQFFAAVSSPLSLWGKGGKFP